jgi:hypothetical protein
MEKQDFFSLMRAGRRKIFFLRIQIWDNYLLPLQELTAEVKHGAETYLGIQQIRVDRIIGTEDRSKEFAESFLPLFPRMVHRWRRVRDLFLAGKIDEAIDVIEYGGYYFVRDGNHRVSVAKTHDIAYMDASVIRYEIPVNLPPEMTTDKIPIFKSKYEFHKESHIFDIVSEEKIGNAHPQTWDRLRSFLYERHQPVLEERLGHPAGNAAVIKSWYEGFFATLMEYVRRNAPYSLFPGLYDLDICCRIVSFWDTLPENSSLEDAYNSYVRRLLPRRFFRVLFHLFQRLRRFLFYSARDERERFFRMSRLRAFRPRAYIAEGKRDYYRFLIRQLMGSHYSFMRQKLGRRPYIDELSCGWYDELYEPALRLYRKEKIQKPFPVFYMDWMKSWKNQIFGHLKRHGFVRTIHLNESFYNYVNRKKP